MKNTLFFSLVLLFSACSSDKLDTAQAQKVGEELIHQIDQENYDAAFKHYTVDFNKTETPEERIAKCKKLKAALGNVESIKLLDSKNQAEVGDEPSVILTFEVKHNKVTSKEIMAVVKDEGEYRVANHSILGE